MKKRNQDCGARKEAAARKGLATHKGMEPLLSAAIYIGIAIAAVTTVVSIGGPAIEKMTDVAAVDQARDALANLDRIMRAVSAEGFGSTRVIPLQLRKGDLLLDPTQNIIYYELDTLAEVISPRTRRVFGNIIMAANAISSAAENDTDFTLQNEHLRVVIAKIGNETNFQSINASQLVRSIYLIDESKLLNGNVSIRVDDDPQREVGLGYTVADDIGSNLPRGRVIAFVNATRASYNIWFTLESGADFLTIEAKNYTAH